jgi:transcriptional regulator GlxA family with amidase domain
VTSVHRYAHQCARFAWTLGESIQDGLPALPLLLFGVGRLNVPSSGGLEVETSKLRERSHDTLIVAGGSRWGMKQSEVAAIQRESAKVRRVASVCTGGFVLAECGLLDGRRATTHWRMAPDLQREYPGIRVVSDSIFIRDDHIWTSAGITSGIDLALALIEEDCGATVARAVSQDLVVYYRRPGGQSQFSAMSEIAPESGRIRSALSYAREHLADSLSVERLAEVACLSLAISPGLLKQRRERPLRKRLNA